MPTPSDAPPRAWTLLRRLANNGASVLATLVIGYLLSVFIAITWLPDSFARTEANLQAYAIAADTNHATIDARTQAIDQRTQTINTLTTTLRALEQQLTDLERENEHLERTALDRLAQLEACEAVLESQP